MDIILFKIQAKYFIQSVTSFYFFYLRNLNSSNISKCLQPFREK